MPINTRVMAVVFFHDNKLMAGRNPMDLYTDYVLDRISIGLWRAEGLKKVRRAVCQRVETL